MQAVIGLHAHKVIATGWGVWMPQIGASLVNEFENKSRQVHVSFTGDSRAKQFTYDTEQGDSHFVAFSVASVFLIKNGVQFYLNAEIYTAYENYDRTIVAGGLRWEL